MLTIFNTKLSDIVIVQTYILLRYVIISDKYKDKQYIFPLSNQRWNNYQITCKRHSGNRGIL